MSQHLRVVEEMAGKKSVLFISLHFWHHHACATADNEFSFN